MNHERYTRRELRDDLPIILFVNWFCVDLFCVAMWAAMVVALTG